MTIATNQVIPDKKPTTPDKNRAHSASSPTPGLLPQPQKNNPVVTQDTSGKPKTVSVGQQAPPPYPPAKRASPVFTSTPGMPCTEWEKRVNLWGVGGEWSWKLRALTVRRCKRRTTEAINMNQKDLEYIDTLLKRFNDLPDIIELRVKSNRQQIAQDEENFLQKTYKELDDLLNDLLAFINVKFPNRKDLILMWNEIDFNPKVNGIKVHTSSPDIIRGNWIAGMHTLKHLILNIKREIILLVEDAASNSSTDNQPTIINDSTVVIGDIHGSTITTSKHIAKKHKLQDKNNIEKYLAILGVIIAILGLIFGDNLLERHKVFSHSSKKVNGSINAATIDSIDLPYLESIPILDKGLFVKYYFNEFIIGGANIESVRFNCRKKNGERIEYKRENNQVIFDINDEPYIEIRYKNKYYYLSVNGRHYSFILSVRQIPNPTLELK